MFEMSLAMEDGCMVTLACEEGPSNYISIMVVSRQHAAFWNPLIELYRY